MSTFDQELSRRLLGDDPWAQALGVEMGEVTDATIQLSMALTGEHMNFLDGAHGGALYSLVDAAVAIAATQDGADPSTIDTHLSLTAGGTEGDVFTAVLERAAGGKTLGRYRVEVTRNDGRTVGLATTTVRFVR